MLSLMINQDHFHLVLYAFFRGCEKIKRTIVLATVGAVMEYATSFNVFSIL